MPTEPRLPPGTPPLRTYYMYVTGGCNLACRHCWITPTFEPNGAAGQCLDYSLYELAIEEALPLGLSSIKFTGGEPLLHPDFVRMADHATKKGLHTWMETNGTLLTRELAHHLKEKTLLNFVSVSLDGATAATHDYMRNVQGSFDRARRGIEYLVEAGYRPQIIMSLYPGNVEEIEPLVKWAVESGCGSVKFNLIQATGRGMLMEERGDLLPIERQLQLGHWIESELQRSASIPLSYGWPIAFQGIKQMHVNMGNTCNIHRILGVLSTGHVAMCGIGTQVDELVYGRLAVDSVAEIWTSNAFLARLRESIPEQMEGICAECILRRHCLGSCAAQNYFVDRRVTAPFSFCRLADEAGLFPTTRRRKAAEQQGPRTSRARIGEL